MGRSAPAPRSDDLPPAGVLALSFSKSAIRRIGKSARLGVEDWVSGLHAYRDSRAMDLNTCALLLQDGLRDFEGIDLSGRLKRTYAIRRKLIRQPHMDLSRMTDVVGMRLLVPGIGEQDRVIAKLLNLDRITVHRDYVAVPQLSGYRAHHIYLDVAGADGGFWPAEVQVRTLRQHYWASMSESFGEAVKEGRGPNVIRDWLTHLAEVLHSDETATSGLDLGLPLPSGHLQPLQLAVLVYNLQTTSLTGFLHCQELALALAQQSLFEQANLGAEQYEAVLLVNAGSSDASLSHMRYFQPRGRPGVPQKLLGLVGDPPETPADIWVPET